MNMCTAFANGKTVLDQYVCILFRPSHSLARFELDVEQTTVNGSSMVRHTQCTLFARLSYLVDGFFLSVCCVCVDSPVFALSLASSFI